MSLHVNDDCDQDHPSVVRVYGNVKPKTTSIDCRTCEFGGMAGCTLNRGQCVRGSEYIAARPVQFWD